MLFKTLLLGTLQLPFLPSHSRSPRQSNMDIHQRIVVDNSMGAALIGVVCASVLYGVSCVQTWYYFNHYRTDVWYIKSLVGAVWLFDTVHQILISHTVYHYVISNYDNPSNLGNLVWSILLEVLFNGFIGLLVQGFLTLRVWRLSNENIPLTVTIGALVLAEFACSAAFTVQSMKLHTWADLGNLKGLSISVNIVGVVVDVFIAGALFYFLSRSRTGFKKSDTMISRLILFTVSTGFLTSLCAIGSLVSILAWGQTLIYVAFYFSIGRLYSNSVLATLNARKSIRGLGEDGDELSFSLQSFAKSGSKELTSMRQTNISIKIDTMQEYPSPSRTPEDEPDSAVTDGSA
ncbi:hypothetical protein FA15DRAFT_632122 [Coprinopsis marcescibilis]|uniref:DUF6534 domain-containing protein n=1 Tax=Coprinopsis marcescibilis TaxID=230819 RepID=A0A5C3L9B7_COPMA|nr:hypothetical protein FA15DRAFT_632122 [Coprinopsis marcescibilis]